MFPDPIAAPLPARADVVVIGGGIIGVCTALALARRGVSVLLCEKGRVGGEQSSRNWGFIRTIGRDPAEIPLAVASHRQWQVHAQQAQFGFRQSGIANLCADDAELGRQQAWLTHARDFGLDARLLSAAETNALAPGAARPWAGALHAPGDAVAEPDLATQALAQAAEAAGAMLRSGFAVRGVETTGGRASAVVTEHGRVACDAVVMAGGAWARLFCGNLGIELPQLKVLGSVCRTAPIDGLPDVTASTAGFSFRKRLDGGYTIAQRGKSVTDIVPDSFRLFFQFLPAFRQSFKELRLRLGHRFIEEARMPRRFPLDRPTSFEAHRVLDPAPAEDILRTACKNLIAAFPGFARMQVVQSWGGLIDATPDSLPVISPVARLPGFFLATGFSAHGFGIAPAAGQLAADLVMGDAPIADPTPFRFDRFARAA